MSIFLTAFPGSIRVLRPIMLMFGSEMVDTGIMDSEIIDYQKELEQRDKLIAEQAEQIKTLEAKVQNLERLLHDKGDSKGSKKPKFREDYSLKKNQSKKKRRKRSSGRRPREAKRDLIGNECKVYPPEVAHSRCVFHREQFAWRIEDGKAVYVRYRIYDLPDSKELPLPLGLRNSRSEFGIEVILTFAFLHYWIGVSIDKARSVMEFFTGLALSKSQADSLLTQLGNDWREQYDMIGELIALSLIVYIDETAWKVGKRSCYTWVFSTSMFVLFRCGVGRDKSQAEEILGKFFSGIGVTDDYSAYKNLFSEHQLCWAHLIRKAIKLALQNPDKKEYAEFLDDLCGIYQQAVRYQNDGRLTSGRESKAIELQEAIRNLCTRSGNTINKGSTPEDEATFIRLQNELINGLDCLFVFVVHPDVSPTNNQSERNIRPEAEVRKGGRTSKTQSGAKRRSVIMTVLASLRNRFPKFTLGNLLSEVQRWIEDGYSIFERELAQFQCATAPPL